MTETNDTQTKTDGANMKREQLAEQIIETCLQMTRMGLNQGTSGNVSVRYGDGMLITPTGIPYEELTPRQIVEVSEDGRHDPAKTPSSEWRFHQAIYRARPDAQAVVHNHAVHCTAVSILNRPIPAIHYMIAATGSTVIPCAPYAIFGSQALSDHTEAAIRQSKAILLQHHGMIACGSNLQKALWLAQEVEVLARLYLLLLPVTPEVPVLSDEVMEAVLNKFHHYGIITREEA